jgi:hypothetical protein
LRHFNEFIDVIFILEELMAENDVRWAVENILARDSHSLTWMKSFPFSRLTFSDKKCEEHPIKELKVAINENFRFP